MQTVPSTAVYMLFSVKISDADLKILRRLSFGKDRSLLLENTQGAPMDTTRDSQKSSLKPQSFKPTDNTKV